MKKKSVEEEMKSAPEVEEGEIDWDESIRLQISELLCDYYGAQERDEIFDEDDLRLPGLFPTICFHEETSPHPVVLGITIPLRHGGAFHYRFERHELPLSLCQLLTEIQEKEGFPIEADGECFRPEDLLYEARMALTVTREDADFAKKHGWLELMHQVRTGARSTHRLASECMGRHVMLNRRVERILRKRQRKKESEDSEDDDSC